MDRERLTELLQDPSQVAKQDLMALRTMAERFPWFSGAHLLLAVGEHETGDVLANDRQSTPAAFLPSRAVLFDLFRQEEQRRIAPLRVVKDETSAPAAAQPREPVQETEPDATAPKAQEADIRGKEVKAALPELPEADLPEDGIMDTVTDPQAQVQPTATPRITGKDEVPSHTAADILERQIQEAILATGYDLGRYEAPSAAPPTVSPEVLPAPPIAQLPDVPVATAVPQQPASVIEIPVLAPRPISYGTRLRFTDWLDRSDVEVPIAPPPPTMASSNPDMPVEVPFAPSLTAAAALPDLSPQEIMEQFIQRSSPTPPAAKAEFFNPQQAAKRSLQDDGLVSETLARIHEKQGNFAKAKEVYDRLAVKHPEKSVYFAALSKALEGRMHK